ncbi:uncharacterized protein LOC113294294 [Papaver somniferum]|uniref:uncharacterized protein LOC113294294 n=1 Tax=Papaver somniferum TaxID=3469 RepID=UPI000E6FCFBA|nr:uncharacterized protein LOC113294294 [Papaver somniferum]
MFHALITNDHAKGEWFISCVYGTSYKEDQPAQWDYIKNISKVVKIPWVLIRYLNITTETSERNTNTNPTSDEVLEHIKEADLHDLGFSGNPYTWTSNSHGTGSDHSPILLSLYTSYNSSGSANFFMNDKLSNTRHILSKWSKNMFGQIQNNITVLQEKLPQLQVTDLQGSNTEDVLQIEKQIDALNEIQASSNRQKSKDHFYNDMDKNSKFFHIKANQGRVRNIIDSLQAPDGSWCQDRSSIEDLLVSHFKKISTTSKPGDSENFLQHIPSCISEQDNDALVSIPSNQEIFEALKLMDPWTSPGPDGFPPGFYQS